MAYNEIHFLPLDGLVDLIKPQRDNLEGAAGDFGREVVGRGFPLGQTPPGATFCQNADSYGFGVCPDAGKMHKEAAIRSTGWPLRRSGEAGLLGHHA